MYELDNDTGGIRELEFFGNLNLSGSERLTIIPEEFGYLSSLTTLFLTCCKSLTTIPEGFGNLSSLTTLHLRGCSSLIMIRRDLGTCVFG